MDQFKASWKSFLWYLNTNITWRSMVFISACSESETGGYQGTQYSEHNHHQNSKTEKNICNLGHHEYMIKYFIR